MPPSEGVSTLEHTSPGMPQHAGSTSHTSLSIDRFHPRSLSSGRNACRQSLVEADEVGPTVIGVGERAGDRHLGLQRGVGGLELDDLDDRGVGYKANERAMKRVRGGPVALLERLVLSPHRLSGSSLSLMFPPLPPWSTPPSSSTGRQGHSQVEQLRRFIGCWSDAVPLVTALDVASGGDDTTPGRTAMAYPHLHG